MGDPKIASQRLNLLQSLTFLDLTEEARDLAEEFLRQSNLPPKASNDALVLSNAPLISGDVYRTYKGWHIKQRT